MAVDPRTIAVAIEFHQADALREARQLYQKLLQQEPDNADLRRRLGEVCQALGDLDAAETAFREALRREPHVGASNNLGLVLMTRRRFDEAVVWYHEALRLQPGYAEAHNNLSIVRMVQGKLDEAVEHCRQALRSRPEYPAAFNNLGMALVRQGKASEAEDCYRRAARLQPNFVNAFINLGDLLRRAGRRDDAAAVYRQGLQGDPRSASLQNELGVTLMELGRLAEAEACYREALRLKPDFASAYNNLGIALIDQGRWDEGMTRYRQALFLQPEFPEAHHNLGRGYADRGMADEAVASFEQAIRFKPDMVGALNNLGNAYKEQGRLDEAVACYRRALAAAPRDATVHSNLLFALLYHPRLTPEEVFRDHQEFGRRYEASAPAFVAPAPAEPLAGRRLRVGYVSPDFRVHVMGSYCELILPRHDRTRFEIFCYSEVKRPDPVTERLQGYAEHWRSLVGLSDAQAADLIRRDRIDLLVDLAGHTGGNRLPVFALRPAPVQATHYGYPATTGLSAVDYRITDGHADPVGLTEHFHTEQLIRLPEIQWCFRGGPALEPGPPPSAAAGHVTFGSFNNPTKVTDEVLALWARILRAVPGARMHVHTAGGTAGDRRVLSALGRGGLGAERVTLIGRKPGEEYFRRFQAVDLCLDPFPYTGCNSTADALWMGVPVVTLAGNTCVSRQGLAMMRGAGLEECIAETPDAYVATAVRLAQDRGRLAEYRACLRERLTRSPLMDPVRFTRHLEAAYVEMWERRMSRPNQSGKL